MAGDYSVLVSEIAALSNEGRKVTVWTPAGKITLLRADVHEHDGNLVEGTSINDHGVLIHGAAIQVVLIDEPVGD